MFQWTPFERQLPVIYLWLFLVTYDFPKQLNRWLQCKNKHT